VGIILHKINQLTLKVDLKLILGCPINGDRTPYEIISPIPYSEFDVILTIGTRQYFYGVRPNSEKQTTRPNTRRAIKPLKV
jgi:hypothetical protein